ncbi:recombinase A [Leptospira ellinghausenii]|uniref:Protein RecA n=1 Tax=Leptospira ellinghausenii TaxID=1917822 RepID=A0A2P2DAP5_9LEPT|nr:recombinase RecA [Leptospira ellinghausenii]GBF41716.1 recombinase A [Leptospira ellinghausenii]
MKKEKADKAQDKETDQRKQAIDAALGQIEKQFGKGSIMRLGADTRMAEMNVVSTGSLDLDIALGIGGFPSGRIIEIYGPESSGKTTLTLSAIAETQKKGGIAAFIDAEHALDPSYAKKLGVNVDDLLVAQPDNGEEALEICESLVRSNAIDLIVIDSVAALVPKAEIEGDMGDSHMGLQARLMSQALRKLTGTISKSSTTVIFINQIRMKIGVMFGSPETTTGGNALKFYASIRLDIRRIETLKEKEEPVGNRVRVKVVKNKCAPPFRQAEFDIMYANGINRESSLIDLAVRHDLVAKAGSWYSYNGEKIGQGKEQVRNFFSENPDIAFKIENQVRDLNGLPLLDQAKIQTREVKSIERDPKETKETKSKQPVSFSTEGDGDIAVGE